MRKLKKVFIALLLTFGFFYLTDKYLPAIIKADAGIGDLVTEYRWDIYPGVEYRHAITNHSRGPQNTWAVRLNTNTAHVKPIIGYGTAHGTQKMSQHIADFESRGLNVLFGVNGDLFSGNGNSLGLVINNGILISSGGGSPGAAGSPIQRYAFGFTKDGQVRYGWDRLIMNFSINNGAPIPLKYVNKERLWETSGVYLYTENFSSTTRSVASGIEVVLNVNPNEGGLQINRPYHVTVDRLSYVGQNQGTPIGRNQVVLSTHSNSPHYSRLTSLRPGDQVRINIDDDPSEGIVNWGEVETAMGAYALLMFRGNRDGFLNTPEANQVHPRTAIGFKANGETVVMVNDGRRAGHSAGLTMNEVVDYLHYHYGCETILNLDGGGSSQMNVKFDGPTANNIVNRPSDGGERSVANALYFIAHQKGSGQPENLNLFASVYDNNVTSAQMLPNSSFQLNSYFTDNMNNHVEHNGVINYFVEGNIGSITNEGRFTSGNSPGSGRIKATSGNITAYFNVNVVGSVTSIVSDPASILVGKGGSVDLNFKVFNGDVPVIANPASLNYSLSPANLGSVTNAGRFVATHQGGKGDLIVSYGNYQTNVFVEVGRQPQPILDFETNIFEQGWTFRHTNPDQGGWGNMVINEDLNYVKEGQKSLRIQYDFETKPSTGTVALELGQDGGTELEGKPNAIGAWVYGDGKGAWFRIQLFGQHYIGDTIIDWVGWRYVETELPEDIDLPIRIQYAVRLVATTTKGNNIKGSIYVDSIRAVYDFVDDQDPYVADVECPTNDSVIKDSQPEIKLTVADDESGINQSKTKVYFNNQQVTNFTQTLNENGSVTIKYIPEPLGSGTYTVKVQVEDDFENTLIKEWSFTVEEEIEETIIDLSAVKPNNPTIYAGEEFDYIIKSNVVPNVDQLQITLNYNQNNLVLQQIINNSNLVVVSKDVNETTGIATIVVKNLSATSVNANLLTFKFKALDDVSGTTNVFAQEAKVIKNNKEQAISVANNTYNVSLNYKYNLVVTGFNQGEASVLFVTENNTAVKDIAFIVRKDNQPFNFSDQTNSSGQVVTNLFTNEAVGTNFKIRAVKAGLVSPEVSFVVKEEVIVDDYLTVIDGASIRTKGTQGLRFTAVIADEVKYNNHGFYLIYGQATVADLKLNIDLFGDDTIYMNGKEVFKISGLGITSNNEFSVVITGIPEAGYLDSITVIPFVEVNNKLEFCDKGVTRSVAEVALKIENIGIANNSIYNILASLDLVVKKYGLNSSGNYEISNSIYENDYKILQKLFVNDWNNKFDTNYQILKHDLFYNKAKEGLTEEFDDNTDLSKSNLYKFFNDPLYKDKWEWFLDYLIDECGVLHASRQAYAIKANGKYYDDRAQSDHDKLFHGLHLSYSIVNFFTNTHETGDYPAIDFTQESRYLNVKNFNNRVYVCADNYTLHKENDLIVSPPAPVKAGYNFLHFKAYGGVVNPNSQILLRGATEFKPIYELAEYSIIFYDGSNKLNEYTTTYNVESSKTLPVPIKAGYEFVGWYTNSDLTGNKVSKVNVGSTGNLVFYAAFNQVAPSDFSVTYELNGGNLFTGYETKEAMIIAFLTDFYNYVAPSESLETFMHGAGKNSGFDGTWHSSHKAKIYAGPKPTSINNDLFISHELYMDKWLPFFDMMEEFVVNINSEQNFYGAGTWTGLIRLKEYITEGGWTGSHSLYEIYIHMMPEKYLNITIPYNFSPDSPAIKLPKAYKNNAVFVGWYDNPNFSGEKLTHIAAGTNNDVTIYARWSDS